MLPGSVIEMAQEDAWGASIAEGGDQGAVLDYWNTVSGGQVNNDIRIKVLKVWPRGHAKFGAYQAANKVLLAWRNARLANLFSFGQRTSNSYKRLADPMPKVKQAH